MAEWIAEGEPGLDVWEMDVRRFGAHFRSPGYTMKRVRETYETYYDIRYPNHERESGRPLRLSSATPGTATTAPRSGRSPAGSGSTGTRPITPPATSRCGREVGRASTGRRRSARSTAPRGRPRRCSTSRRSPSWRSSGPGAAELWSGCATTAWPATSAGSPTPRCSTRSGGIECDFTVARLADERFSIVTGTAFGNHDREWIRRHLPDRMEAWCCAT